MGPRRGRSAAVLHLLLGIFLALALVRSASATPLPVMPPVNDLWSQLATSAAKETVKAIKKGSGIALDFSGVPMETFQVLVGRQHQLAVEVEGVTYNLLIGNEAEALAEARQRAAAAAAAASAAAASQAAAAASAAALLPGNAATPAALTPAASQPSSLLAAAFAGLDSVSGISGSGAGGDAAGAVAPLQLFSGSRGRRALELPATVLTGPLELLLREPEPVGIYTPHAADVGGPVRRVLLEAGASVRVAGLRRVDLRRPLELPRLPGQYLAEAYAQAALQEPEEGFESAPGIMFMAAQLRAAALKAANSSKPGQPPPPPLLSLEVETVAPGALSLTSAPELPPDSQWGFGFGGMGSERGAAPRLRVRRLAGGTVELSLRQGQVSRAVPGGDSASAAALRAAAALARPWAWPLPYTPAADWLPYETLLRGVLAAHPFDLDSVIRRGVGLRLTRSTIQGVHLVAFDMEVRARQPRPRELEGEPYEWNERPLEVWEAVVQVQPLEGGSSTSGGGGSSSTGSGSHAAGYSFVPLHVARKQSYQNTLSLSRAAVIAALMGNHNGSVAGMVAGDGYDQLDLGIAANAP